MAESTLTAAFTDIQAAVGKLLGYGYGSVGGYSDATWTTAQQADIDFCCKAGLRKAYYPTLLTMVNGVPQQSGATYDWSFIKPVQTFPLLANTNTIQMPDDFGGIEGSLTVKSTSSTYIWPIELTGEGRIREAYSVTPSATGRPIIAAVQPLKGTTSQTGQRFQLFVYPLADMEYDFQVAYYLNPDYLTSANPYALGGMNFSELVKESCLREAELFLDDLGGGPHDMEFQNRLAACIGADRKLKPQHLGYNRDLSDAPQMTRTDLHGWSLVKIYGKQY